MDKYIQYYTYESGKSKSRSRGRHSGLDYIKYKEACLLAAPNLRAGVIPPHIQFYNSIINETITFEYNLFIY